MGHDILVRLYVLVIARAKVWLVRGADLLLLQRQWTIARRERWLSHRHSLTGCAGALIAACGLQPARAISAFTMALRRPDSHRVERLDEVPLSPVIVHLTRHHCPSGASRTRYPRPIFSHGSSGLGCHVTVIERS